MSKVYHGTEFALAFLYRGINDHTHANFQRLLESAIERGEQIRTEDGPGTHGEIPSASVNIEITWERWINEDHALERLRDGEDLTIQEIGKLIRYGRLDEDDWELIRELQLDSE